MSFNNIEFLPCEDKGALQPVIAMDLPEGMNFVVVHVFEVLESNETWHSTFVVEKRDLGVPLPHLIENLIEGQTYSIYFGFSSEYAYAVPSHPPDFPYFAFFIYQRHAVIILSREETELIRWAQHETRPSPWIVDECSEGNSHIYRVVRFFAGVDIHYASEIKGVRFFPIRPGLSNIGVFDAIHNFLHVVQKAPASDDAFMSAALQYEPMYAIELPNIVAPSEETALEFSRKLAFDISTIVAIERGDRPRGVATFIRSETSGEWRIIPDRYDYRGNLLAPMFGVSNGMEPKLEIIRKDPRARLTVELYVQAVAERDKAFSYFRFWGLLEMIAENNIQKTKEPLRNLDGSPITLHSGKSLTNTRKEGAVYSYLRDGEFSAILQQTIDGKGSAIEGSNGVPFIAGETITLWEAVAAAYKIRNEVAHEGSFKPMTQGSTKIDTICRRFYNGEFGFIETAARYAVFRELHRFKTDSGKGASVD